MLDDAQWETANAAFLNAALTWLRGRLTAFADRSAREPAPADEGRTGRRGRIHSVVAHEHLPFDATMDPPPALITVGRRFGLSAFELDVLLLCVAMELDTRTHALCAHAQDDPQRPYPTFALALSLFDEPAWEALSPERPLRYWRLIDTGGRGAGALTGAPLRADERIVNFAKGLNHLDERLMDFVVPIAPTADDGDLPASQQQVAEAIFRAWKDEYPNDPAVVKLIGHDAPSSCRVAMEVAVALGRRLFRVNADGLPRAYADLDLLARLWRRESALLPVALYLDASDVDWAAENTIQATLRRFAARAGGFIFLACAELGAPLGLPTLVYDVAKPTPSEQRNLWQERLHQTDGATAARLVSQFHLDAATIATIARRETQLPGGDLEARLWTACRAALRPDLDAVAQRLEPKATWDDLILPEQQRGLLHQIAAQIPARHQVYQTWGFGAKMNRGFGVTALFAGDSGTGKTMSAEVIANALALSLYRIDLSAVVSKYIGETEKNLRKLFDAADDGGAILFFDEADALFGKRSEVRDSHDRYANIETNYLLQRLEAFRGLAILATNMKSSLDAAFTRRLRFIVNFPHPGIEERRRMWERAFPPAALAEPLDLGRLAKLNLTGAVIAAAALNAAFLAVSEDRKITLAHVLTAVRQEFIKADRPVNEADFALARERGAA
jgi:hypothetical protein